MTITTTPAIIGKTIVEYKQIVMGDATRSTYFAWTRAEIGNQIENAASAARCEAINRMIAHATKVGANAVVGVAFGSDTEYSANGYFLINASATGTAVIIE